MTALIRGGTVRPHVQSCADAIAAATGAESFGTYPGHDPSLDLATDIFVPVSSTDLGDAITEYLAAHWERHGVDYWIYRQRIRNPPDRDFWRAMEDRGSNTANHVDHVHVSFLESAPPAKPKPAPKPKEIEVSKVAYPVTVPATASPRRTPVPATRAGRGWAGWWDSGRRPPGG